MIANLDPSVPLIADADTGYGGPIIVGRTVAQYIRAGWLACISKIRLSTSAVVT